MKYIITLVLILSCKLLIAQDVEKQFFDFNASEENGTKLANIKDGEKILPLVSALSAKKQAVYYYVMASLYEKAKNLEKASVFYQNTLRIEPNYYISHLALAYIYSNQANDLAQKINSETSNKVLRDKYINEYKSALKKSLPHFEKAQACDPNEQVLISIKRIYESLKDSATFNSLELRLKELSKNCVDVLVVD